MKFRVTMKDPDALHDAVREAVEEQLASETPRLSENERHLIIDTRCVAVRNAAGKWFKYGEYLTVEIDTDAGTAVVVPK